MTFFLLCIFQVTGLSMAANVFTTRLFRHRPTVVSVFKRTVYCLALYSDDNGTLMVIFLNTVYQTYTFNSIRKVYGQPPLNQRPQISKTTQNAD